MTRFVLITFLILITAAEILMAKATTTATKADNDNISDGSSQLQLPWKLMKFQLSFLQKSADHNDNNNIANPPESMMSNVGGGDRSSSSSSSEQRITHDEEEEEEEEEAEAPGAAAEGGRKILRRRDKSSEVAGGGVIIGGLVTVFSASLYCYIRVTRTRK